MIGRDGGSERARERERTEVRVEQSCEGARLIRTADNSEDESHLALSGLEDGLLEIKDSFLEKRQCLLLLLISSSDLGIHD
jgi:hypothetical protein